MRHNASALLVLLLTGCGPGLEDGNGLVDDILPVTQEMLRASGRRTSASGGPTVLFLNFAGGQIQKGPTDDPAANMSYYGNGQVPPFQGDQAGVVSAVKQLYSQYNVQIVTNRPSGDYVMAMVGGTPTDVNLQGPAGTAGLAPLDCGNLMPSNVAFIFSQTISDLGYTGSLHTQTTAEAIAHEVAHTFGLPHSSAPCDLMSYGQCSQIKTFLDQNMTLMAGQSGQDCGLSSMNSHQMVTTALGAPGSSPGPTDPGPGPTPGDTTPPVVQITAPQSGAQVGSSVTVSANINDDQGVTQAELRVDGTVRSSRAAPPYEFTVSLQPGQHSFEVRARDAAGNEGSATIWATVGGGTSPSPTPPPSSGPDTAPPTVVIYSPQGGTEVQPQLTVSAGVSDDRAVTLTELLVDGNVRANAVTPPYDFSITLPAGSHQITVRAFDGAGNQGDASLSVVVLGAGAPQASPAGHSLEGGCSVTGGGTPPPLILVLGLLSLLTLLRRRDS